MSRYESPVAKFCRSCNALLGHEAREQGEPVWLPIRLGTVCVSSLGYYCNEECQEADPNYRAAMDDAAEAATRYRQGAEAVEQGTTCHLCEEPAVSTRYGYPACAFHGDHIAFRDWPDTREGPRELPESPDGAARALAGDLCQCGHPQIDHLNREANCIGQMGRCQCGTFRAA